MRIFRELEPGESGGVAAAGAAEFGHSSLGEIRAIVGLGSARGGVGKSALTVNVAAALAAAGRKVGIVDADLNSPSIASMLGMKAGRRPLGANEIDPGAGPLGLRVVSSEYIPDGEPPPVSFVDLDAPGVVAQNGAHPNELSYLANTRRLIHSTRFGALDLLLVDLAPGLEQIYRLLKVAPGAGIVIASHSSELSARAMKAALSMAARSSGAVIGVVENMTGFNCDGCRAVRPLMPHGAIGTYVREAGVPLLERLPFDPRFAETCDRGLIFVREYPDTPLAKQLVALANSINKSAPVRPRAEVPVSA